MKNIASTLLAGLMIILGITILFCLCSCRSGKVNNTPVRHLDTQRYLGVWYEIARFDHSFERGIHEATAVYSIRTDGKIMVENSGIKSGKRKTSVGKAKLTDTPGLLRVSFFGPFYSDYRVLWIDDDYNYVLVGSGSANYLWILSRSPQLPKDVKDNILVQARSRHYDTDRLIWVRQHPETTISQQD